MSSGQVIDRNPRSFVDIYSATEDDFQGAMHTIHRSAEMPSDLTVGAPR